MSKAKKTKKKFQTSRFFLPFPFAIQWNPVYRFSIAGERNDQKVPETVAVENEK